MIQDWGFDYLYLHHEQVIMRVNLKDHSYRDVTHSPREEFDLMTSQNSLMKYKIKEKLMMFQAHDFTRLKRKDTIIERNMKHKYYYTDLSPIDLDEA